MTQAPNVAGHESSQRSALPGLVKVDSPRLGTGRALVAAPLQQYDPKEIAWAKENMPLVGTNKLPFLKQVEAYNILSLQKIGGTNLAMEVQVFRLSDEVAIVGLPGRSLSSLAWQSRRPRRFRTRW